MKMTLFPGRTVFSVIRLSVLLAALFVCLMYVFVIYRVNRSHLGPASTAFMQIFGARIFQASVGSASSGQSSEITRDAAYAQSLASQVSIAAKCETFFSQRPGGRTLSSQALNCGLSPAELVDAWGRPFEVRLFASNLLLVASTGASGLNKIPEKEDELLRKASNRPIFLVDDNLVILRAMVPRKADWRDSAR